MRWILVASMALAWGCGGSDDDDGDAGAAGGAGGAGDAPAMDCQARCEAKLTTCGQAAFASAGCTQLVCGDATESQLVCLEGSACDAIAAAIMSSIPLCGIGEANETCPELSGCACGVSGVVTINGQCAMSCDEACAAFGGM